MHQSLPLPTKTPPPTTPPSGIYRNRAGDAPVTSKVKLNIELWVVPVPVLRLSFQSIPDSVVVDTRIKLWTIFEFDMIFTKADFFYVLLNVQLSIILAIDQLNAQILVL